MSLRAPGEARPVQLHSYGECDDCHRVAAIAMVAGHMPNGDAYGLCQRCKDLRERPASGSGCATPSPAASGQERGAAVPQRIGAPLRLLQGGHK